MGYLLGILVHLFLIFALSSVIAVAGAIITYFAAGREKRTRKIFFAIISPFIGLYTFYFTAGLGATIVSEVKKVDIGTGEHWYVPLTDKCRLAFIDVDEQAFIECKNTTVVSDVSHLQQAGSKIYAETYDGEYFVFDVAANKLKQFPDENEFRDVLLTDNVVLKEAPAFYDERRSEVAGTATTISWVLSLAICLSLLYLVRRIVMRI